MSHLVISRTPLRISFAGGGSDLSSYYQENLGCVVSVPIKKYIYITLNKRFDDKGTYLPKEIKKISTISTNKFKRKDNKFFYVFEEIFIFLINIFYTIFFLFYFTHRKKTNLYLNALKSNYFIIPKYFKSFYFVYNSLNLTRNDNILFPTGRRKDLSLINFLSKIDSNHPKFHLRMSIPQKDKFKGFFYYLKKLITILEKKIFLFIFGGIVLICFYKKILKIQKVYTKVM